ncbi:unnamed protein product [Discula destructiva]
MSDAREYKISVSPSLLWTSSSRKLALAKFPDTVDGGSWEYGVAVDQVKRIAKYWQNEFSWTFFEERLNRLPHFEATIDVEHFDAIQLHFLHQRSEDLHAIPLLFIHGWPEASWKPPRSWRNLQAATRVAPSVHIVVPSLPNFGFSRRVTKPGFGLRQYSEVCHKLMQSLGYKQYATQGGDWGAPISTSIGVLYPESLLALHLNLITAMPPALSKSPIALVQFLVTHFLNLYTPRESEGLQGAQDYQRHGNGYMQIQKTRPSTIGVLLADSPVGLLGWMYEKLRMWTDDYQWTEQEVCEWVSLYWFSRAGPAASVVIYHETFKGDWQPVPGRTLPSAKLGFSYFPKEMFATPCLWNRQLGDVVFEKEHEKGGHFAAWEQPEALVDDRRTMFNRQGPAYHAFHGA